MSLITRTDVTAVKFYKNLILAGIGSTIKVFDASSANVLQIILTLEAQKIYGFVVSKCGEKILVFGGKQFTVISMVSCNQEGLEKGVLCKEFNAVVCNDWLHSSVWINEKVIALLTAHNVVQTWDTRTQKQLSQHTSTNNSILYSGLLLSLSNDILVMAGTVFSEVIVHRCGDKKPLHNLKGHKGVIFSITCKPEHNIIVTTSDDRSIRVWGPNNPTKNLPQTTEYWQNIDIVCKHELYGHLARVMRSCITDDLIVSVGEDSAICYWDYDGKLIRKAITHQNGGIWAVDSNNDHLVTGGGDCGVILHPLSVTTEYSLNEVVNINVTVPKKVEFTARRNVIMTDDNNMIYYDFVTKNKEMHELKHESTYKLLSLSSYKQVIAVADMTGKLDIFVENCKGDAVITKLVDINLNIGKVLSMHWAGNRHLVFCTDNRNITVFSASDAGIEKYTIFILPPCKDALLTAVAVDDSKNYFAAGDRCGNLHVFVKNQSHPIKSFSKVHGRYGPRSILFKGKDIVTTGRDHSIKHFSFNEGDFKLMTCKDLPFAWIEKFLDRDLNIVCGFQERIFVAYNIRENSKIIEIPCGGGHRSFDAIRYKDNVDGKYEEIIKLVYLKDADINVATFQLNKILSKNIINGSHAKEINCLKTHGINDVMIYITGGEDTTLRISSEDAAMDFEDRICFKHLSSVRTIKTHFIDDKTFLLISGGGRAQICVKKVKISEMNEIKLISEELIDYLIKGTDKERKGNQSWRNCHVDFDPEMRIMDMDVLEDKYNFIIIAGCSDAFIRIFTFKDSDKKLELINEIKYHSTCILKTKIFKILDKDVLITCSTRGDVAFWHLSNIKLELAPFLVTKTNKSGINSLALTIISDNKVLIATGGDDNTIHIILLKITDQTNLSSIDILSTWNSANYHSSQITGLCIVDNYLLSASIDQRVTLFRWGADEARIECSFLHQMYTDVADVQGMDLMKHDRNSITVCVFGKGLEVMAVPKLQ